MRILHVIITLDPAWGGPPRVAARMAAAQATLGHEVRILSYGTPQIQQAVKEMTASIPGFAGVDLDYLEATGWKETLHAASARARLRELLGRFDVVHIHNVWDSIVRAGAAEAQRLPRTPYFIQPNGILDVWCMQQKRLKKLLALRLLYRRMLDSAAGLCLGNEDERQAIAPLGLKAPTTLVPLNAVFPEEVKTLPPAGNFYKRYPQLNGKPFIVFLGRLHIKKGLDFLADSFGIFAKSNATTHLVVIGHDEGAQSDFQQRIARHGVQDRVHLVGPLHGEAKWEAFRDASCFALPSRQEGFSIAITEALACGLPVVISNECHFAEVAQTGAGEVVELNAQKIADAFGRVFASDSNRARMSHAAKRLVETRFNCLLAAKDLVDVYQRAIGQPATAASQSRLAG